MCLAMLGFEWRILLPSTWPVASPAHLDSSMMLSMRNQALGSVIAKKLNRNSGHTPLGAWQSQGLATRQTDVLLAS